LSFTTDYIAEATQILAGLDVGAIERVVEKLAEVRRGGGRLFFLGVGGSAANASHAVNDFRKIAGFEAYAPTDNVSELTARVNDESWEGVFVNWLKGSRLRRGDMVFVFSVGGHARLPEVMRYVCTGIQPDGRVHPPHDYGSVILLTNLAGDVVPPDQVMALRRAVHQFLHASHVDMFDKTQAGRDFQTARDMEADLPPESRAFMHLVNTRDVRVLPFDVSRKLKIARIPTPPSALIVGNYWSCTIHDDREICKITLVVCTDDQSQCVEV
jgi:hypothetical protein